MLGYSRFGQSDFGEDGRIKRDMDDDDGRCSMSVSCSVSLSRKVLLYTEAFLFSRLISIISFQGSKRAASAPCILYNCRCKVSFATVC